MDLRQFLAVLRTRWRFFVAALGLGAALTTYLTLATPAVYASSATLFVSTPSTGLGFTDAWAASLATQERTKSYVHLVSSTEVLQRSADRLGGELTVSKLEKDVSARFVEETLLLDIEARADSPQRARQITSVVADEVLREIRGLEKSSDGDAVLPFVVNLASAASLEPSPVEPKVIIGLGTGFALSLMVAIAATVSREMLDATVKSSEGVRTLTGASPLVMLPIDEWAAKGLPITSEDPGGASSEAVRLLRTNLQFADLDGLTQTILVTSALPGAGKTFVATKLALSMARAGRSVLLLNADMRHSSTAPDSANPVGLVSVLLGRASIEQATQKLADGVDVMDTGPLPPNPAEFLEAQAMKDLLAKLRGRFDVIVIDVPSMLPTADAAILLPGVDGALLVAQYGVTHRKDLQQALARIEAVGGALLGIVVNGAPLTAVDRYGYRPDGARTNRKKVRSSRRGGGRRANR